MDYPEWSALQDDPAYCLHHTPTRPQESAADAALAAAYQHATRLTRPPLTRSEAKRAEKGPRAHRKTALGGRRIG